MGNQIAHPSRFPRILRYIAGGGFLARKKGEWGLLCGSGGTCDNPCAYSSGRGLVVSARRRADILRDMVSAALLLKKVWRVESGVWSVEFKS